MLGVPLHGDDVAPRFCSADRFMLAELDGDRVRRIRRLSFPEEEWSERLERLSAAGVRVLLCGGFNRSFLPLAESFGIQVIFGLAGEAERLIDAFLHNEIERYRFLPCGGGRGRRRGGRWSGRGHEGARRQQRNRRAKE
jgi:predicted Fe-Mo cluster-binding NifX family protein